MMPLFDQQLCERVGLRKARNYIFELLQVLQLLLCVSGSRLSVNFLSHRMVGSWDDGMHQERKWLLEYEAENFVYMTGLFIRLAIEAETNGAVKKRGCLYLSMG